jgi:hypothetical protein
MTGVIEATAWASVRNPLLIGFRRERASFGLSRDRIDSRAEGIDDEEGEKLVGPNGKPELKAHDSLPDRWMYSLYIVGVGSLLNVKSTVTVLSQVLVVSRLRRSCGEFPPPATK